jgi:hypothetical protein
VNEIPLTELASVIRSKNSGPFELTLDILFHREKEYTYIKETGFFTKELISRIYGIPASRIIKIIHFDPAWAVKITLMRPVASGAVGDSDVYGAQQHAPLLGLTIPLDKMTGEGDEGKEALS